METKAPRRGKMMTELSTRTYDNDLSMRDHSSDARLLAAIGQNLRASYRDVLQEPLPERLAALVRRLDGQGG